MSSGRTTGPTHILGGLPVIIEVAFGQDGGRPDDPPEWYCEAEAIYWMKRDGSKGKEIPQSVRDRAFKYDYGLCSAIDEMWDNLREQDRRAEAAANQMPDQEGGLLN